MVKKSTRKVPFEMPPSVPLYEGRWKCWYTDKIVVPILDDDNSSDESASRNQKEMKSATTNNEKAEKTITSSSSEKGKGSKSDSSSSTINKSDLGSVSVPAVTVPSGSLGSVSVPAVTVPSGSLGSMSAPAAALPDVSTSADSIAGSVDAKGSLGLSLPVPALGVSASSSYLSGPGSSTTLPPRPWLRPAADATGGSSPGLIAPSSWIRSSSDDPLLPVPQLLHRASTSKSAHDASPPPSPPTGSRASWIKPQSDSAVSDSPPAALTSGSKTSLSSDVETSILDSTSATSKLSTAPADDTTTSSSSGLASMMKPVSTPTVTIPGASGSKVTVDTALDDDNLKRKFSTDDESKSELYEVGSIADSLATPTAASAVPLSTFTSDVADTIPGSEDSKNPHGGSSPSALKSKLGNVNVGNVKSDHIDPLKKVVGTAIDNKAAVGGTTNTSSGAISKTGAGCCVCM